MLVCLVLLIATLYTVGKKPEPAAEAPQEKWCEVGEVHYGAVSYASSDQQKELLVIARQGQLPLLLEKCE